MSVISPSARRTSPSSGRAAHDRRRHNRFPLTLLGRFMRANKHEYPCKLNDISVGGAAMTSPVSLDEGEKIIAYFDQLGGIEGTVVRVFDGGFAIRIAATQHKREKLAAQITLMINKPAMPSVEDRRHVRQTKLPPKVQILTLAEGISIECRVLDVSLSGASIETEARPPIGNEIVLGKLRGRVIRYHDTGIGIQFLDVQETDALRRYFG